MPLSATDRLLQSAASFTVVVVSEECTRLDWTKLDRTRHRIVTDYKAMARTDAYLPPAAWFLDMASIARWPSYKIVASSA